MGMSRMERERLRGVVIISLPPPDDPDKGKTVTAFTISDNHDYLRSQAVGPPMAVAPMVSPSTAPHSTAPHSAAGFRSSLLPLRAKKAVAAVLGLSLLLFSIWACIFSEAPVQLLRGQEEDGQSRYSSILLPLYSKFGAQEVTRGGGPSPSLVDGLKLVEVSVRNSSAVIPLRGNVLPDGKSVISLMCQSQVHVHFKRMEESSKQKPKQGQPKLQDLLIP